MNSKCKQPQYLTLGTSVQGTAGVGGSEVVGCVGDAEVSH